MTKTLVGGSNGQLGQCLQYIVQEEQLPGFIFMDIDELDILDSEQLKATFEHVQPDYFINCAAYTAVDLAEDEEEKCRAVNKTGALNLARCCKEFDTTLLHVSTDFVFEGSGNSPLKEGAPASPVGMYGLTKLEGERALQNTLTKYFIIRTSWLYSEYGGNFVKTMLRLGREKERLNVVADQIGTPTYAMDLAHVLLNIIKGGEYQFGLYHYSNEGVASWYDFSKAIFDLAEVEIQVAPIPTSAFPTKAKRPTYSVLDKTKIKEAFGIEIPYWRESLKICIQRIKMN